MQYFIESIRRKLVFPMAVALLASANSALADVTPEVQAIFNANCLTGCHDATARGGLNLSDAATSEAQLVDIDARCNTNEKRVVAGDPDNSVLYQKLSQANPDCGGPMPQGAPMLSVADQNTIADWITSIGPAAQFGLLEMNTATLLVQETDPSVTLTVNRQLGTQGQITVDYAVATVGTDSATSPDDYIADAGTLTFADGENVKTITVTLADDDVFEGTEVFSVTLSNVINGAVLGTQAQTKVSIQDNEFDNQPGTFFFSAVNYNVDEGAGTLDVTIIRSFGAAGIVTVDVASTDGSAAAGADFNAVSQTLQFAEGERNQIFTLTILEDQEIENDEALTLRLSNPANGAILGNPQSVTVIIGDNDGDDGGGDDGGGDDGGGDDGGDDGSGDGDDGEQPVVTEEEYEAAGSLAFILPLIFIVAWFRRKK